MPETVATLVTVDARGDDEYAIDETELEGRVFCRLIAEGELTGYILLLRGLLILLQVCASVASVDDGVLETLTLLEPLLIVLVMVYLSLWSPVDLKDDDCSFSSSSLISMYPVQGDADATVVTGTDASAVLMETFHFFPFTRQLVYLHGLQSICFVWPSSNRPRSI